MLRLLLMRHGKAEPFEGELSDFDRALAPRGRGAAALIGNHIGRADLAPDRVLCSPSTRTRQTASTVIEELSDRPDIAFPPKLYNASTGIFIEQIQQFGGNANTLLVVGHNPATEEATELLRRIEDSPIQPTGDFPTAALAVFEFAVADWPAIKPRSGRLTAFVRPRSLE